MKLKELIWFNVITFGLFFLVTRDLLTIIGGTIIVWFPLIIRLVLDEDNLRGK